MYGNKVDIHSHGLSVYVRVGTSRLMAFNKYKFLEEIRLVVYAGKDWSLRD